MPLLPREPPLAGVDPLEASAEVTRRPRPSLPPPPFFPKLPPPPRPAAAGLPPPRPAAAGLPPPRAAFDEDTRPDVRLRQGWESAPCVGRSPEPPPATLRPAALTVPAPRRPTSAARAAGYGVMVGLALFAAAWILARPARATATVRVVVTATDPQGLVLNEATVLVDGAARCDTTPCTVDLEPGAHRVDVVGRGEDRRAGRSFSAAQGERVLLHFALPAEAATLRASPVLAPAEAPVAVASLPREAEGVAPEHVAAARSTGTADGVRKAASAARLDLDSTPVARALVDGRPVGSTPLVGLPVSAGTHTVTFAHPELGRRSATVDVGPGARKAVVVRFEGAAAGTQE